MQLTAFLLPATLSVFSLAFGIVWKRRSTPAFWWMIAYAAQGLAYLGEIVPTVFHETIDTMVVDTIFVVGFFAFGQALCCFFGWPRRTALGLILAAAICAIDAWQIFVAASLKGELLTVDFGLAALVVVPLLLNLRRLPDPTIERALLAMTMLTVLNCVTVSSLFAVFGAADASFDTYMETGYVSASYAVTSFLNIVVPLVQLAAVALRAISDHRAASEIDVLTGLMNRRGFERACADARRTQRGTLIACDIDRFKGVNDGFGHAMGDLVIAGLADAIRSTLPPGGFAARIGGEEFVLFLPGCAVDEAVSYAEAVSSGFTAGVAPLLPIAVTSSFGIATVGALSFTGHDDLRRADRALYAAKQAGRDTIRVDQGHHGSARSEETPARVPALRVVA